MKEQALEEKSRGFCLFVCFCHCKSGKYLICLSKVQEQVSKRQVWSPEVKTRLEIHIMMRPI